MSLAFELDAKDEAGKLDKKIGQRVDLIANRDRMNANIGQGLVLMTQNHLRALGPNKQFPGRSTHFWADAARRTNYRIEGSKVTVAVSKQGVSQRYFGGEIHAVKGTYLAIPAREEYYGESPRKFNNLRFAVLPNGGPVLVEADAEKGDTGFVAYWLRRSVNQQGNPKVLPTREQIGAEVLKQISRYLKLKFV